MQSNLFKKRAVRLPHKQKSTKWYKIDFKTSKLQVAL